MDLLLEMLRFESDRTHLTFCKFWPGPVRAWALAVAFCEAPILQARELLLLLWLTYEHVTGVS